MFGSLHLDASKLVHLMHNSEQPVTCYGITDTGAYLVTDNHFDGIMQKLKGVQKNRLLLRVTLLKHSAENTGCSKLAEQAMFLCSRVDLG